MKPIETLAANPYSAIICLYMKSKNGELNSIRACATELSLDRRTVKKAIEHLARHKIITKAIEPYKYEANPTSQVWELLA